MRVVGMIVREPDRVDVGDSGGQQLEPQLGRRVHEDPPRARLDDGPVAVERNLEVVPRKDHATTELRDGDRIEIVHFVGGG